MHVGPYEIVSQIGVGGMGEVYRARDPRVERDVAIKVPAEQFSERFRREARAVASLNHPNICHLYDVGPNYLVMELITGNSPKGPLPLKEVLRIARQIADALEAAHEKGIVHRDLKPGNIRIKPDGTVKVLDFGLAIVAQSDVVDAEEGPTETVLTQMGMVVGSAPYMSPEQAQGKPVDKRTDIWAFGALLYELLSGKPPFRGATIQETLVLVLTTEPDWSRVPAEVRPLLRRCLEKDSRQRLRDIGDAMPLVNEGEEVRRIRRLPVVAIGAALIPVIAAVGWVAWREPQNADRPLVRFSADLGPDAVPSPGITVAVSPDGSRIAYPVRTRGGEQMLATRALDQNQPNPIVGTEGAVDPFFSPDGQWVGFVARGRLKKVSIHGGAAVIMCDVLFFRGGAWLPDGSVVASLSNVRGLSRIDATGGTPRALTQPKPGEFNHRWPHALPGGKKVIFTASTTTGGDNLQIVSPQTGEIQNLQIRGSFARYLPTDRNSGHLIYFNNGSLFGVQFDPDTAAPRGSPVPLLDDLAYSGEPGGGQLDVSRTGLLVYLSGRAAQVWTPAWLDAAGKVTPLLVKPGAYSRLRVSPDGNRITMALASDKGSDIYVYDLRRDSMTRLTFNEQRNSSPIWSHDGQHIAYSAGAPTGVNIEWVRSDGGGQRVRLLENPAMLELYAFTPDGKRLAYTELSPETGGDIWTLPLDISDPEHPRPGKPELFLRTPVSDQVSGFSRDGRWIAYMSNRSGRAEIYVRPFPGPGGEWQVSIEGGMHARWSRNGRELFFEAPDRRIMVAEYTIRGTTFAVVGRPRVWAGTRPDGPTGMDLAPAGNRVAILVGSTQRRDGNLHAIFLLNFFDELRRKIGSPK
jgi:serine/threonine-protein kinase